MKMLFQKLTLGTVLFGLMAGCAQSPDPAPTAVDLTNEMAGRWDVAANEKGNGYPLWFEIVVEDDTITGRLQPRGGATRVCETIEISEDRLVITAGDTTLEGTLLEGRFQGVGQRGENRLEWTAVVAPTLEKPSDIQWGNPITLFNGKDMSGWKPASGSRPSFWKVEDGVLVNEKPGSHLMTDKAFWNFKLSIEVNCPEESNSGIYLRGRYEVQVEDNYGMEPSSTHMGGIYGQISPTSNPAKPAGEWQKVEVVLLGRWVTVDLNGTRIIDDVEIAGCTGGALDCNESEPGPLLIQGDHGAVSYRNIVLTPALL